MLSIFDFSALLTALVLPRVFDRSDTGKVRWKEIFGAAAGAVKYASYQDHSQYLLKSLPQIIKNHCPPFPHIFFQQSQLLLVQRRTETVANLARFRPKFPIPQS